MTTTAVETLALVYVFLIICYDLQNIWNTTSEHSNKHTSRAETMTTLTAPATTPPAVTEVNPAASLTPMAQAATLLPAA